MAPRPARARPRFARGIVLVAAAAAGCGYRFAAARPLPGGVAALYVPVFANATAETGAEILFSRALRDELALRGLLARGAPDATARGEILTLRSGPSIVDPGGAGLVAYRLEAAARVRIERGVDVVAAAEVEGAEDYLPGPDVLGSEANRRAAVHRLATALMRDAVRRLRSDF